MSLGRVSVTSASGLRLASPAVASGPDRPLPVNGGDDCDERRLTAMLDDPGVRRTRCPLDQPTPPPRNFALPDVNTGCAECDESLNLGVLIVGAEVEMQAVLDLSGELNLPHNALTGRARMIVHSRTATQPHGNRRSAAGSLGTPSKREHRAWRAASRRTRWMFGWSAHRSNAAATRDWGVVSCVGEGLVKQRAPPLGVTERRAWSRRHTSIPSMPGARHVEIRCRQPIRTTSVGGLEVALQHAVHL